MFSIGLGDRILMAGVSGSGKTHMIVQLLQSEPSIFQYPPTDIHFYAPSASSIPPKIAEMSNLTFFPHLPTQENVKFYEKCSTTSLDGSNEAEKSPKIAVIIDDFSASLYNSPECSHLCRVGRHYNIYLFICTQNLFSRGKYTQDINQNFSGYFLFYSPRMLHSLSILSNHLRCFNDSRALSKSYIKFVDKPYSYIFVSLAVNCGEIERFQTDIFNSPFYKTIIIPQSIFDSHPSNIDNF